MAETDAEVKIERADQGGQDASAVEKKESLKIENTSTKEEPPATIKEEAENVFVVNPLPKEIQDEMKQEVVQVEHAIEDEKVEGDQEEGEPLEGDQQERDQIEGDEVKGENLEGEQEVKVDDEQAGEEQLVGELEGEQIGAEQAEDAIIVAEHELGEQIGGEHEEGEEEERAGEEQAKHEEFVEEEGYVEEPPPDPAAPFNFSDSKEALKDPYELRPYQIAEVEQLWELYQNYTPAYTDINGYITVKELCYMLKCLLIYPFTEEQLQELIEFTVRPPHPEGHITYDQFVHMIKLRQRDFPQEEELRLALQVFDPEKSGLLDRDNLKDVLMNQGHKISEKLVIALVKEVDLTNDGTLGVEDIVGTMAIDMNRDDIILMQSTLNTLQEQLEELVGGPRKKDDDDEDYRAD